MRNRFGSLVLAATCLFGMLGMAQAQEGSAIEIADGKLAMKAPAQWKVVPPKNRMIAYEYAGPADAEKDKQARITVSTAGGKVEDNLDRWYGQFEPKATKESAKLEKLDVAGQTIHVVDLVGTFKDTGGAGPFQQAPAVKRENYRMLGAIVETKGMGLHFIKITGPTDSVEKLKEGFRKMLEGLEAKK